jgi:hypothetical protein
MKVLIAVPTFETIAPECFKAIYELQGDDLTFDFVRGYDCAKARNEIAKKALNGGFDYVLMVDSDIVIPPGHPRQDARCARQYLFWGLSTENQAGRDGAL